MACVIGPQAPVIFGPPLPELAETGPSARSDAVFAEAIGREPALPLYLSCSARPLMDNNVGYEPGRICMASSSNGSRFRPDLYEVLCRQDVLHACLYDNFEGAPPFPLVPEHKEVEAVIRDVGPQVVAVLVANDGAETGFMEGTKDGNFLDPPGKPNDEWRREMARRCTEFVKVAGNRIRDLGARPAFGLYQTQVLLHAYWLCRDGLEQDELHRTIIDLDALIIVFIAFSFWLCEVMPHTLRHWDPMGFLVPKRLLDPWPFQRISDWLQPLDCWGGVNYMAGLLRGNDLLLRDGGFKAGVIGELPPGLKPEPGL